uniref:Spike protein n=1 Tax=Porcine epidemic diarrhea virus TaxID=28295 RepID=W5S234_PEDV|nr:spike protein [Porcine epidemic diarrhea virus]
MKSLTYFWLFLPVLSTLSLPQDVTRCSANTNFRRFFSKFNVQAPAVVVLGGYLPIGENQGVNSTWYCAGQHPTASGVHGIFLSHIRGGHGFEIGISQEPFDPSGYQLYLHKATNGNTNATARLRICQFPSSKTLGPTANDDVTTGRNCLFNKAIPAHMSEHSVVGITWDNDRVTVFSDKIYYFYFKNDWSRVATKCYNSGGCAMQYVYEPTYYMLNVTSAGEDGISYQPCTANCIGYAANVFATEPNGHIPEGFSFNNWFLLSNDSTLVHGKVVSNQPLLVNCLLAIPKIYGLGQFFSFNHTIDGVCNGAAAQRAPEALRFNINDTSVILAEGSIVLHTALGTNFSFVCSNSSNPHLATFALPLGATQVPYYCFLKVDTYNSTVYKFLAVLPPTVREIVITKYGDVYVNGFGYLHLGLLDAVTINFTGHGTDDDVSGFWTIASTNFVDALIEVQGTAIQRILYCDDPVSQLKCSQVAFDLDDGFYPISSRNLLSHEQPISFVTLPSFNDHSFVNITVSASFGDHSGANLIASDTTINGFSSFCVDTRQFTISLFYNVTNSYGYVSKSQVSNCPFTLQSVNDYLSFSKFCVSTSLLASACTIDLFGYPEFGSDVKFTSLYFQFTKGELITGTPKPLEGVTDVSFMTLDVCTKYTIYGFKGEGIITLTNSSFLAGVYYTSDSGQLLAFKNVTSGAVYSVTPCSFSEQAAYVDEDYKRCSNGRSVADLVCAQYYSGVMVLPGVVDAEKLHMYSASLIGGMALGGFTAAAALPFSYAVQARLNYLALQTDVLQRNQQLLAESFNSAIGNITSAFESVKEAISQTSQGLNTVAHALTKVQEVVNSQGAALSQLTIQLQHNFQAISSSIDDIYSRLDILSADVQVDRLITGRLSALNAFVAQTLTKYTEVQASRRLAQQKVNECVKSQSQRYGFCGGDGEHIFSLVQAAPQGLLFLHTVLVPGDFVNVTAIAGLCVNDDIALTLREPGLVLFTHELQTHTATEYFVSSRRMFEPRKPTVSDFVQIESCVVTYVNLTSDQLPDVIPDYIDVNKTLDEILASLPNRTDLSFPLDVFNATYLNLTGEIADLEQRSESLRNTTEELRSLIYNINNTLVDLEWLNRVETYIKWPWWVWLIIFIVLIFVVSLLVFCCISTGCCGCCGCCCACFSGCCRGPRLQPYEAFEKVHVQ